MASKQGKKKKSKLEALATPTNIALFGLLAAGVAYFIYDNYYKKKKCTNNAGCASGTQFCSSVGKECENTEARTKALGFSAKGKTLTTLNQANLTDDNVGPLPDPEDCLKRCQKNSSCGGLVWAAKNGGTCYNVKKTPVPVIAPGEAGDFAWIKK
jgi:hypothetical protein